MSQKRQNFSKQPSSRVRKVAETISALRFLRKQSRSLPRELEAAKLQPVPQAVLDAYAANKSVIGTIYGTAHVRRGLLYHGTGALQYDGDKYATGMTGRLRRPIDAILVGGLRPHADPWALTEGSMLSVSFATVWSYARFYAEAHQTPDEPLEWEYGDRAGWFSYCIVGTARRSFGTALLASNVRALGRPKKQSAAPALPNTQAKRYYRGYNRLQRWALDVRSDITFPDISTVDVICGRTDIPGNFGTIITVSEDDVPLAPMGLGGTYEKRAARSVGPREFTSLAVPLNKVEEYAARVHDWGIRFQCCL